MLLICAVSVLLAQQDRGVITGTVKDATGAVVPGAQVTAVHTATNANYKTNTTTSGDFTLPSLPVGAYRLRVEIQGFKAHVQDNVVLAAGGTARVDVQLELGTTLQTVEVSAKAQLLESETARLQAQVDSKMVDSLPLVVAGNMRSAFDLAVTTPGVETSGSSTRVGGGQAGQFGITLDGVSAGTGSSNATTGGYANDWVQINTPSVDAITEFSVDTGGFKAEYGQASGGLISFVSKSGTNKFNGSAYEFLRNNAMDARSFFAARTQIYKQHDFGATAGGPVWIPKLYNGKDKTFFFFSYEGFRNRVGATATPYSVAPPEFYTGDLHNFVDQNNKMIPIYDPASTKQQNGTWVRDVFPNNQIPQARFDSLSKVMMQYGSAVSPNVAGLVPGTSAYVRNNYISNGAVSLTPFNKTSFKVDQYLKAAHRLAFYFGRTTRNDTAGPNGAPGLPGALSSYQMGFRTSDVYRLSWDYTIGPRLVNRFNAGGNNWREDHWSLSQNQAQSGQGWKNKFCLPNVPDCDTNLSLVSFNGEFTGWGGYAHNGSDNPVVDFNDDMTYVRGKHTFKWGYAYDNTHYDGKGQQDIAGNTTFDRSLTSIPLNTNQATGGGSAFAAFLLGDAYSGMVHTGTLFVARSYRGHAFYFQDDWRANSRLTLNIGLRYEFELPPLDGNKEMTDFDPTLPNPKAGGIPGAIIFGGTGPMTPGWYGALGPRLGFAYRLSDKTVIRGAFARSFGAIRGGPRHAQGGASDLSFVNTSQGLYPAYIYSQGVPAYPLPPNEDPSVANGASAAWFQGKEAARQPETLDSTFSIQRQLKGNMMLEVNYHGVAGSHLPGNPLNYNQVDFSSLPSYLSPFTAAGRSLLNASIGSPAAIAAGISAPYPSFTGSVAQALRPFPQYTSIGAEARGGHSTYHALAVSLQKRYSFGLTFQGSYVLSKALTDTDSTSLEDQFNRTLEKSIASYDQTHSAKVSYVYELPFGQKRKWLNSGLMSRVVGGWRISGTNVYQSGFPMGLGTTISFPVNTANRPYVTTYDGWRGTSTGAFDPNVNSFLQPASFFGTQPTDRVGNMTRYNPKLRNFPSLNENVSLAKSIVLHESLRLDLRGEAFNLFNRVLFGPLSSATVLQNPNFGLWRAQSNSPRQMQLALKLYW
jgi:hypothetical protein